MPAGPYRRVLLKLSGEVLAGSDAQGYDFPGMRGLARELGRIREQDLELALVLGGGNLCRGREAKAAGMPPLSADRMGMLATVMNGLALAGMLEAEGHAAQVFSAVPMGAFVPAYVPEAALGAMAAGKLVIAAGGIGQPFFSTDTTAALRAIELGAELLLKGTQVDGVYSADPRRDPDARRLPRVSYDEVLSRQLGIMDATAIALCRDHGVSIRVFNFSQPGILERILRGEDLGSQIGKEDLDD